MIMNENIFSSIQDDNTAYWIGFLAADGSINNNQLSVGLSIKDYSHIQKLKTFLNLDNDIQIVDKICNNKFYKAAVLSIKNFSLIKDLSKYNIIQSKSKIDINFFEPIPEKYKMSFVFGLFDGDGWFSNGEVEVDFGLCGNKKTIISVYEYLYNYFNWDLTFSVNNYTKSPNTYYFQTSSRKALKDFIQLYLSYSDKCDLLDRKVAVAKNILEKINNYQVLKEQEREQKLIICPICKKHFMPKYKQIYCSQECVHKSQQHSNRPSRKDLKELIRTKSFLSIGDLYGVSDNTIRKWCKAMNLPFKKTIIQQYSDIDWELI